MNNRYYISLILLALVTLSGCVQIVLPPPRQVCPVKPQGCISTRWEGMPIDTTWQYRRVADNYYVFENLKKINSPEDEWALSFIDDKKAVLTVTDGPVQTVMKLKFYNYDAATFESGIGIPMDGSIGAFSFAGNDVIFAATPPDTGSDNILGNADLYSAVLQGNILIKVKNLGKNVNSDITSWEAQPSISSDKKVIFFASDRQGSYGTDIWFTVQMKDGSWSIPINCGDSVNSNCDEITPFVTKDGKTLLFSSCGHESVGGYDIFSSSISPEFWKLIGEGNYDALKSNKSFFGGAKNLRPPLNTPNDELFPSSPGDYNDVLYYSSNQNTGYGSIVLKQGGFDMYVRKKETSTRLQENKTKQIASDMNIDVNIKDLKLAESKIKFADKYTVDGKVYNAQSMQPIPKADIIIRKIGTEKTKTSENMPNSDEIELSSLGGDLFYDSYKLKSDTTGNYDVTLEKGNEFEITAQGDNTFFESFKIRIEKNDTTTFIHKDFYVPVKFALRINFPTDVYKNPYKYTIDSNGVESGSTWQEEVNNVAKNIMLSIGKIQKIILIGNTDDVGSIEYNEKLGLNRVNFVIDELVKRGVPRELLEGKSAGKLEPLPVKTDEPLQLYRKRLRRVELQKVLKS